VIGRALAGEDDRGKKKGARKRWSALYRRCGGVGDRPRAVPRGSEAWGGGSAASTAVGRRGVAGSGPAAALTGGARNKGGQGLTSGPCYSPRWWRFEYISNSNEFKLLQNLSNFDQSKNSVS
jgi:hypothetical protein